MQTIIIRLNLILVGFALAIIMSHTTLVCVALARQRDRNHYLNLSSSIQSRSGIPQGHRLGPVSNKKQKHHGPNPFVGFSSLPHFENFSDFQPVTPFSAQEQTEQLDFAEEGLIAHNKYRELHNAPPLKLDSQLGLDAYEWAVKVAADCDEKNEFVLIHSGRADRGENLYASRGLPDLSGTIPVDNWYDEIKMYDWKKPGFYKHTGHFTQLIWKDTTTVGLAFAKGKNGFIVAVAQYKPFGNIMDADLFRSNVLQKNI